MLDGSCGRSGSFPSSSVGGLCHGISGAQVRRFLRELTTREGLEVVFYFCAYSWGVSFCAPARIEAFLPFDATGCVRAEESLGEHTRKGLGPGLWACQAGESCPWKEGLVGREAASGIFRACQPWNSGACPASAGFPGFRCFNFLPFLSIFTIRFPRQLTTRHYHLAGARLYRQGQHC